MIIDRDFILNILELALGFLGIFALVSKINNLSAAITCFFIALIIRLVNVCLEQHDYTKYEEENNDE